MQKAIPIATFRALVEQQIGYHNAHPRANRGAYVTGVLLMRCLHKVTQPAPSPKPHRTSSAVFYAPAEQVKAHKYDARVRILSACLGKM